MMIKSKWRKQSCVRSIIIKRMIQFRKNWKPLIPARPNCRIRRCKFHRKQSLQAEIARVDPTNGFLEQSSAPGQATRETRVNLNVRTCELWIRTLQIARSGGSVDCYPEGRECFVVSDRLSRYRAQLLFSSRNRYFPANFPVFLPGEAFRYFLGRQKKRSP